MQKERRCIILTLVWLIVLLSYSSSLVISPEATASPQVCKNYGGILRIADEPPGGPFGVPWKMPTFGIIPAVPVFETLLWVDRSGRVYPKLAEHWEVTHDRKALILRLRRGVLFHDGNELDSNSVKYSLEESIRVGRLPNFIQSVDTLSRYTVRINLSKWTHEIYLALSGSGALIASHKTIQQLGEERAQWRPIGSGPFRLVRYDPNSYAEYVRFHRYWDSGKPCLDRVILHFIRDAQTRKVALLAREVDVAQFRDPLIIREILSTNKQMQVFTMKPRGIQVLVPDSANSDSPFVDQRVREALMYAFDRKAMAEALGYGLWEPWTQLASPESRAALLESREFTFNTTRAKQLLSEAGYKDGFTMTVIMDPSLVRDEAVTVQKYLQSIGIRAMLEFPDRARMVEYQNKGWRGLVLTAAFGGIPNYTAAVRFYLVRTIWKSLKRPDKFEQLLEDASSTLVEQRYKVQQLHQLLLRDLTLIPLYLSSRWYVAWPNIRDTYHMEGSSWPLWRPAEAWKEERGK